MANLFDRVEDLRKEKQAPLAQQAYAGIKEAILNAQFKPGDMLSEKMLANVLEMSRTPVREALKELASEGLVEILPGRGASVKDVSIWDLNEIYELRVLLECLAAQKAIDKIPDTEIAAIEQIWLDLQKRAQQKMELDWAEVSREDNNLHSLFIKYSDNAHLRSFMEILNQKILRFQLLSAQALGNPADTIKQHLEIIQLIKERKTEELVALLRQHIEKAAANINKRYSPEPRDETRRKFQK